LYTDNITYFVFREHEMWREGETDEMRSRIGALRDDSMGVPKSEIPFKSTTG